MDKMPLTAGYNKVSHTYHSWQQMQWPPPWSQMTQTCWREGQHWRTNTESITYILLKLVVWQCMETPIHKPPYAQVVCTKLDSNHFAVAILPCSKCLPVISNYIHVSPNLFPGRKGKARERPQEFITFGLDIITQSDIAGCLKELCSLLNFSCTHAMNARQGLWKTALGLYHTSGWHHCKQWGGDLTRLFCGSVTWYGLSVYYPTLTSIPWGDSPISPGYQTPASTRVCYECLTA